MTYLTRQPQKQPYGAEKLEEQTPPKIRRCKEDEDVCVWSLVSSVKMWFLALYVLLVGAEGKFYTDCGSKLASIQNVGVSGCSDDAKECVLKRNTNASITIDFTPSNDVKSIETEVHGIIMNLPVPFPLSQPDACKDNGLTCPLKGGEKALYRTSLPVLKSYPKVKVDVKWQLTTDDGDLVCIIIPARIQ
ncbi:ML domain-containing protein [Phthorimaea operculella]|nr:ML domain-containing protein [Phthorimaea operculella]